MKFIIYDGGSDAWLLQDNPSWWCDPFATDDFWPCVHHAYGFNAIDVEGRRYFYWMGDTHVVSLDEPRADAWGSAGSPDTSCQYTSIEYFPEMGALVFVDCRDQSLAILRDGESEWDRIDGPFPMGPYHNYTVYNPARGVVLFGGGNGSRDWYELNPDGSVTELPDAPRDIHPSPDDDSTLKVIVADPTTGDYLAYAPTGELFRLSDGVWARESYDLPSGLDLATTLPDLGAILWMDTSGVWVHKP